MKNQILVTCLLILSSLNVPKSKQHFFAFERQMDNVLKFKASKS